MPPGILKTAYVTGPVRVLLPRGARIPGLVRPLCQLTLRHARLVELTLSTTYVLNCIAFTLN